MKNIKDIPRGTRRLAHQHLLYPYVCVSMKVYILREYEPYESPQILWIYKTKESANKEKIRRQRRLKWYEKDYLSYGVSEEELLD